MTKIKQTNNVRTPMKPKGTSHTQHNIGNPVKTKPRRRANARNQSQPKGNHKRLNKVKLQASLKLSEQEQPTT